MSSRPRDPGHARPLIGATTSEVRRAETVRQTPEGEPPHHEMALGLDYLAAIEAAGGIPVVIPPMAEAAIEPLLDQISGICLSGGPDIDPSTYGAPEHPNLGPTEPNLDQFELAVAHAADARVMPILAICRGAQALNVTRGGTLHQHLPDQDESIEHRQDSPGERPSHRVEIDPESLLASCLGATELDVNSFHHQAVEKLGEGLKAVAFASDGTIEGIEAPGQEFCVGVQWHAELLVDRDEELSLFQRFVAACHNGAAARNRNLA